MTSPRKIQHQDLGITVNVLGCNQDMIRVTVILDGTDRRVQVQPADRTGQGHGRIRELVFAADTEPGTILRWLDVPGYRCTVGDTWWDQAAATFVKEQS